MVYWFEPDLSESVDICRTINTIFMIWTTRIFFIVGVMVSMKFSIVPDALQQVLLLFLAEILRLWILIVDRRVLFWKFFIDDFQII